MICAWCGEEKELCRTGRVGGIMQPMPCRDCLIRSMSSSDWREANLLFWLQQLADDEESLLAIRKLQGAE